MGLRRQAASHLQHPRGPAEVSRLLSVSDARVWSVDMEEMSFMEEEGGRLSLLFTAAPVLRESTAAGGYNVKESWRRQVQKYNQIRYFKVSNIAEICSMTLSTTSTTPVGQNNHTVSMMRQEEVRFGSNGFHRKDRQRLQCFICKSGFITI